MYPFYKQARSIWVHTQERQIEKGLEKYGKPFDPYDWNTDELLEHAVQESVDQLHYLTGLGVRTRAMHKDIHFLLWLLQDTDYKEPIAHRLEGIRDRYKFKIAKEESE